MQKHKNTKKWCKNTKTGVVCNGPKTLQKQKQICFAHCTLCLLFPPLFKLAFTSNPKFDNFRRVPTNKESTMNVWIPYWFGFRQLALVPFPNSLDIGGCLKFELENPEPNAVYSYKSIWTGRVQFKWPKSCLKFELFSALISVVRFSDIQCTYSEFNKKSWACQ